VVSDELVISYIDLATMARWDKNPKRHDLSALAKSIARHGFKMPPRYEPTLNGGAGGIVAGNGRADVLSAMRANKQPAPRGVRVGDDGTWYVPVVFGVDAESQTAAEAFGLDDNNLTMAGGDFTDLDMAGMWEPEGYAALLRSLAEQGEIPVSIDATALDALLAGLAGTGEPGDLWQGMPEFEQDEIKAHKSINVYFDNEDDYQDFARRLEQSLTAQTRAIWHPKRANDSYIVNACADES